MFSFLVQSKIFPSDKYEWFTYKSRKPVQLKYRTLQVFIEKGDRFGVRKSVNGKDIRLIVEGEPNRVVTLTLEQAQALAKGVK